MKPNFEGFAREIVGEHPDLGDWDSTDIMEAAIRHGLFAAVPGGFDPATHSDRFHRGAQPGDTHYELTYDIAKTQTEIEKLRDAAAALLDTLPESYAIDDMTPEEVARERLRRILAEDE